MKLGGELADEICSMTGIEQRETPGSQFFSREEMVTIHGFLCGVCGRGWERAGEEKAEAEGSVRDGGDHAAGGDVPPTGEHGSASH